MKRHFLNRNFVLFAGKLYAVFGRRQGRVIAAENALGFGGQFRVLATLPVPESFDLATELRTQTSGLASPQLVFSHWEVRATLKLSNSNNSLRLRTIGTITQKKI